METGCLERPPRTWINDLHIALVSSTHSADKYHYNRKTITIKLALYYSLQLKTQPFWKHYWVETFILWIRTSQLNRKHPHFVLNVSLSDYSECNDIFDLLLRRVLNLLLNIAIKISLEFTPLLEFKEYI